MIEGMAKDPVRRYLAGVEAALHDVQPELRDELVEGLSEELQGLSPAAARARIKQMGSPSVIAAEARIQVARQSDIPATGRREDPAWYSAIGVLFITVGGIFLPVVGAIVGYAMMWTSRDWTKKDKKIATWTVALATTVATIVVAVVLVNTSNDPPNNPLTPAWFDAVSSGVIFLHLVNVIVGIRLLAKRISR
jgi:hypothetical protein